MSPDIPLRIAMFTGPERCGIAHYTADLIRAMPPGVEVQVIRGTFDSQTRAQQAALGARLNDADVIHVQHEYAYWGGMAPDTGYFAFMAALRRPVVMTVHELDLRAIGTRGLPAPLELAYKRWMNRRVFTQPQIRHWLTHSADVTAALLSLGVPLHAVETLPMPAPAAPLPPSADPQSVLSLSDLHLSGVTGTGALSPSANGAARRGQIEALHRSRNDSATGLIGTKGGEAASPAEYSAAGYPVLRTDDEMATEREIRRETAKAALGLQGRRVLTIFGFLARRKGYDLALQALARLPEDVTLLAAGGVHGADRTAPDRELKALAERLGVGEQFRITGYLAEEEVPGVFAATDLLLAPFREVSGSASLALGQAYGCPILASDLPPLRESGAALFPAGDAPALAAAVTQLLTHSEERERLAAVSRAHAARHSYRALAERTAAIYQAALP